VRWSDLGPQIADRLRYRVDWNNIALGLTIFTLGLAKKVLIADTVAPVANAAFGLPTGELSTLSAAIGVVAYAVALLRLQRLLGHGPRAGDVLRHPLSREFRPAVRLAVDHRVLAALAHVALPLVPGLPVHPARWQPRDALGDVPEPRDRVPPHGPVARRELDVRALGRLARRHPRGRAHARRARRRAGRT